MDASILDRLSPVTPEERALLDGRQRVDRALYSFTDDHVINSSKLLAEGRWIAIRPHTRFVHFPEHTHDYIEVVYMCRGSTTHIVDGTRICLREGELLFLSQKATQEILPAGENDLAVNFIVLPQFFDRPLSMLGTEETPLKSFLISCLRGEGSSYLHFRVSDVLPVQNLVENLLFTLIEDAPHRRQIRQTTMGLLLLELLLHTDKLSRSSLSPVFAVMDYIENHYHDGSLTVLAEELHYDFAWLSREIKRKTGKTYTELVQEKRLAQAAYYLKHTGLRVEEVARAVGYENISYFHRLFARCYGCSPKKFRDANQDTFSNK